MELDTPAAPTSSPVKRKRGPGRPRKTQPAAAKQGPAYDSSSFDSPSTNGVPSIRPSASSSISTNTANALPTTSSSLPDIAISSSPPEAIESGRRARPRRSSDFEVTQCRLAPDRKPHSFFSRSVSKGMGVEDAIDVERSHDQAKPASPAKAGPKKIVFASDNKTTHSFFSRVAPLDNVSTNGSEVGGIRSRASSIHSEVPTIASATPIISEKEKRIKSPEKKKVHAFFKSGGPAVGKLKDGWGGGVQNGDEWAAPWPRGDWPNHEAGTSSSTFLCSEPGPSTFQLRRKKQIQPAQDSAFWQRTVYGRLDAAALQSTRPSSKSCPPPSPYLFHHPAFSAIQSKSKAHTSNRDPWTDRYGPVRAAEVLGNELESVYLRDWLATLAVGHHDDGSAIKAPKVVRKVRRQKRSALLDGWIVDDLGLYGNNDMVANDLNSELEEEAELEELDEPEIHHDFNHRPNHYRSTKDRLTNTILLTGPHGSGKTAAVYATAAELGWDVFEVYPGIGKRTGGNLMALVGDVGKNHILAQGHGHGHDETYQEQRRKEKGEGQGNGNGNGLKSFFNKMAEPKKAKTAELGSQGSAAEPITIDADADADADSQEQAKADVIQTSAKLQNGHGSLNGLNGHDHHEVLDQHAIGKDGRDDKVRQSLILIDEADILFDEESTFWPAVISLIADSRRPVVMTCNGKPSTTSASATSMSRIADISGASLVDHLRIPRDQLPLQAILQFRPPPSHIALPYLKAVAQAEASHNDEELAGVAEAQVEDAYNLALHHTEENVMDHPLPPNGHEPVPYFDLRKAITQLQLGRGGRWSSAKQTVRSESITDPPVNANDATRELKALARQMEVVSYADAHIDLRPVAQLDLTDIDRHGPTPDDELGVHALIKVEMRESYPVLSMNDRSSDMAQAMLEIAGGRLSAVGPLHVARTRYIRSTLPILDPIIPISAPLLPHSSLFLHTLPTIQRIVAADDILQEAETAAVARGENRVDRKTGRPVRGGKVYKRWFPDLRGEGLEMARVVGEALRS